MRRGAVKNLWTDLREDIDMEGMSDEVKGVGREILELEITGIDGYYPFFVTLEIW